MADNPKNKPSLRSRQCMFVLYPESQQAQIEYCQKNLPCAWALHDKDIWEKDGDDHKKGDLKKPHVHFVCKFPNARYFSGLAKEIGKLKLFVSSLPPAGAEGDRGQQKEPHDDMKKSSHTNKTDALTGLLFMRH